MEQETKTHKQNETLVEFSTAIDNQAERYDDKSSENEKVNEVVMRPKTHGKINGLDNVDQYHKSQVNNRRAISVIDSPASNRLDVIRKSLTIESKSLPPLRKLSALRPLSASTSDLSLLSFDRTGKPASENLTTSGLSTRNIKSDYPKVRQSGDTPFQVDVLKGIAGIGLKVRATPKRFVQITEIQSGGPVGKNGNVRVGDYLLFVNSTELTGQTDSRVQQIMRLLPRGLTKLVISGAAPVAKSDFRRSINDNSYYSEHQHRSVPESLLLDHSSISGSRAEQAVEQDKSAIRNSSAIRSDANILSFKPDVKQVSTITQDATNVSTGRPIPATRSSIRSIKDDVTNVGGLEIRGRNQVENITQTSQPGHVAEHLRSDDILIQTDVVEQTKSDSVYKQSHTPTQKNVVDGTIYDNVVLQSLTLRQKNVVDDTIYDSVVLQSHTLTQKNVVDDTIYVNVVLQSHTPQLTDIVESSKGVTIIPQFPSTQLPDSVENSKPDNAGLHSQTSQLKDVERTKSYNITLQTQLTDVEENPQHAHSYDFFSKENSKAVLNENTSSQILNASIKPENRTHDLTVQEQLRKHEFSLTRVNQPISDNTNDKPHSDSNTFLSSFENNRDFVTPFAVTRKDKEENPCHSSSLTTLTNNDQGLLPSVIEQSLNYQSNLLVQSLDTIDSDIVTSNVYETQSFKDNEISNDLDAKNDRESTSINNTVKIDIINKINNRKDTPVNDTNEVDFVWYKGKGKDVATKSPVSATKSESVEDNISSYTMLSTAKDSIVINKKSNNDALTSSPSLSIFTPLEELKDSEIRIEDSANKNVTDSVKPRRKISAGYERLLSITGANRNPNLIEKTGNFVSSTAKLFDQKAAANNKTALGNNSANRRKSQGSVLDFDGNKFRDKPMSIHNKWKSTENLASLQVFKEPEPSRPRTKSISYATLNNSSITPLERSRKYSESGMNSMQINSALSPRKPSSDSFTSQKPISQSKYNSSNDYQSFDRVSRKTNEIASTKVEDYNLKKSGNSKVNNFPSRTENESKTQKYVSTRRSERPKSAAQEWYRKSYISSLQPSLSVSSSENNDQFVDGRNTNLDSLTLARSNQQTNNYKHNFSLPLHERENTLETNQKMVLVTAFSSESGSIPTLNDKTQLQNNVTTFQTTEIKSEPSSLNVNRSNARGTEVQLVNWQQGYENNHNKLETNVTANKKLFAKKQDSENKSGSSPELSRGSILHDVKHVSPQEEKCSNLSPKIFEYSKEYLSNEHAQTTNHLDKSKTGSNLKLQETNFITGNMYHTESKMLKTSDLKINENKEEWKQKYNNDDDTVKQNEDMNCSVDTLVVFDDDGGDQPPPLPSMPPPFIYHHDNNLNTDVIEQEREISLSNATSTNSDKVLGADIHEKERHETDEINDVTEKHSMNLDSVDSQFSGNVMFQEKIVRQAISPSPVDMLSEDSGMPADEDQEVATDDAISPPGELAEISFDTNSTKEILIPFDVEFCVLSTENETSIFASEQSLANDYNSEITLLDSQLPSSNVNSDINDEDMPDSTHLPPPLLPVSALPKQDFVDSSSKFDEDCKASDLSHHFQTSTEQSFTPATDSSVNELLNEQGTVMVESVDKTSSDTQNRSKLLDTPKVNVNTVNESANIQQITDSSIVGDISPPQAEIKHEKEIYSAAEIVGTFHEIKQLDTSTKASYISQHSDIKSTAINGSNIDNESLAQNLVEQNKLKNKMGSPVIETQEALFENEEKCQVKSDTYLINSGELVHSSDQLTQSSDRSQTINIKQTDGVVSNRKWILRSNTCASSVLIGDSGISQRPSYDNKILLKALSYSDLKVLINKANNVLDSSSIPVSVHLIILHVHGDGTPLGIELKNEGGILFRISGIKKGSPVYNESSAEVGDLLLAVDSLWCDKVNLMRFLSRLAKPKHESVLVFARENNSALSKEVQDAVRKSTHDGPGLDGEDEAIQTVSRVQPSKALLNSQEQSESNNLLSSSQPSRVSPLTGNTILHQETKPHSQTKPQSHSQTKPQSHSQTKPQPHPRTEIKVVEQPESAPNKQPVIKEKLSQFDQEIESSITLTLSTDQKMNNKWTVNNEQKSTLDNKTDINKHHPELSSAIKQENSETDKRKISVTNISSVDKQSNNTARPTTQRDLTTLEDKHEQQLATPNVNKTSSAVNLGPGVHKIVMTKGATGVGFCLEGGIESPKGDVPITIKRIFKGGPAEKCGLLKVKDEIVEVNGLTFTKMGHYEAWNHLKFLDDGEVHITIRRTS